MDKLSSKVCFIHFEQEHSDNIRIARRFSVYDYFTSRETKDSIRFKLERARRLVSLLERNEQLKGDVAIKDKEIEKNILVDPLTECFNWRYFLKRARQELSRARRHYYQVSFLIVDIDYFRQINEIYGSKVADNVIKDLVSILARSLRKEDILARWREDEFFIILPYLSKNNAYKVAERLKKQVSRHRFKYKTLNLQLRVSIGLVSFPEDKVFNTRDIINSLDSCLIAAKRKGGNVVILSSRGRLPKITEDKGTVTIDELKVKIDKLNVLLVRDLLEMIYGFARAIEAKDQYTGKHVEDTARIAEELAKQLKLPKPEIENVKRAAILHDLGKVGIDQMILSKKGKLTVEEREIVKSHPWIATEILREIHVLRGAIPAILYHHEYYNGQGYPLGLKGQEIPLSARIVAVADVYQALISNRPYRKAYSRKKAINVIMTQAGKQFDPAIIKAFLKIIKRIK